MSFDLPDLPEIPDSSDDLNILEDECNAAFSIGFVGIGQAGSNLVESFWNLGYRKVLALNTATQDLNSVDLPEENKLLLSCEEAEGAGKDPEKGRRAVESYKDEVFDLFSDRFGEEIDLILVCYGAGGGTGSGGASVCIDVARRYFETSRKTPRVGALVSLPKTGESALVHSNAYKSLSSLQDQVAEGDLSPLILIDNAKIGKKFKLPVANYWNEVNSIIASHFHLFNDIAAREDGVMSWSFDAADFDTVLKSGIITFGATKVSKYDSPTDVSSCIRKNLSSNMLVEDLDLSTADTAACIFVGSDSVLKKLPEENLEYGFEQIKRLLEDNSSVVHRGVYSAETKGLRAYTMVGGMLMPGERMREISRLGNTSDFYGD